MGTPTQRCGMSRRLAKRPKPSAWCAHPTILKGCAMKTSYLSSTARHSMQNQTFPWANPGRTGNPAVRDGLWTGGASNHASKGKNHKGNHSGGARPESGKCPAPTLGILVPSFSKAPKRKGK